MENLVNTLSKTIHLLNENGNSFELNCVDEHSCNNELDYLYNAFHFDSWVEVGYSVSAFIYPRKQLEQMQDGWYYIGENRLPDNEHWKQNWVVFGGWNEDAIFYDTETKHVYGCIDKKTFFLLGHSLTEFLDIMNFCMDLECSKYGIGNVFTDDEEYSEEYLADIEKFLVEKGEEVTTGFIGFFCG